LIKNKKLEKANLDLVKKIVHLSQDDDFLTKAGNISYRGGFPDGQKVQDFLQLMSASTVQKMLEKCLDLKSKGMH
jgi:hypothetical protein